VDGLFDLRGNVAQSKRISAAREQRRPSHSETALDGFVYGGLQNRHWRKSFVSWQPQIVIESNQKRFAKMMTVRLFKLF